MISREVAFLRSLEGTGQYDIHDHNVGGNIPHLYQARWDSSLSFQEAFSQGLVRDFRIKWLSSRAGDSGGITFYGCTLRRIIQSPKLCKFLVAKNLGTWSEFDPNLRKYSREILNLSSGLITKSSIFVPTVEVAYETLIESSCELLDWNKIPVDYRSDWRLKFVWLRMGHFKFWGNSAALKYLVESAYKVDSRDFNLKELWDVIASELFMKRGVIKSPSEIALSYINLAKGIVAEYDSDKAMCESRMANFCKTLNEEYRSYSKSYLKRVIRML